MSLTHTSAGNQQAKKNFLAALITSQIAGLIMAVVVMLVFTLFLGI